MSTKCLEKGVLVSSMGNKVTFKHGERIKTIIDVSREEFDNLERIERCKLEKRWGMNGLMEIQIKWQNDGQIEIKACGQSDFVSEVVRVSLVQRFGETVEREEVLTSLIGETIGSPEVFDVYDILPFLQ